MKVHADSTSMERYPLQLESKSLFPAFGPGERDPAAGGNDPVPRQLIPAIQRPHRESRGTRETGRLRDLAVGDHLASRHARNHPT